jgi:hypothetical protein
MPAAKATRVTQHAPSEKHPASQPFEAFAEVCLKHNRTSPASLLDTKSISAILGSCCSVLHGTLQVSGSVHLQQIPQLVNLCLTEFGMVASRALINQSLNAVASVCATPVHKTRTSATCGFNDLLSWVAIAIQSHRLIARGR